MIESYDTWLQNGSWLNRQNGQSIFYRRSNSRSNSDGPDLFFLHGFPTNSYDWLHVFERLSNHAHLLAFDFLGFGASAKPWPHQYNYSEQADIAEEIADTNKIISVTLIAHDYGVSVAQELLKRQQRGILAFRIEQIIFLNGAIYHELHRPTIVQRLLILPIIGPILSSQITKGMLVSGLNKLLATGHQISDEEGNELWKGVARANGNKLLHALLHYMPERKLKGADWEHCMETAKLPITLIWGVDDPVSGDHVLQRAKSRLPEARVVALTGVGHYPQLEAADEVAAAIDAAIR